MNAKYEIGGVCVDMTESQATRWNAGETSNSDLDRVRVHLADGRTISLRQATSRRLEREISAIMHNMPANCVR